jgi:hypothetical protein
MSNNNLNLEEIQNKRVSIKISLDICSKVLDNFANLSLLEVSIIKSNNYIFKIKKNIKNCESECYDKYIKMFNSSTNENKYFMNYKHLKDDLVACTNICDSMYKQVIEHQRKGAEISSVK